MFEDIDLCKIPFYILMMKPIDALDWKILAALQQNGRLSNVQLADAVGLSASPCWQRVKRMEGDGLIQGYTTVLDQGLLGQSEIVLIEITLERHEGYQLENVCQKIAEFPEVLEVHITSGELDCFIKVACDGTRGYEEFLKNKLYKVPGIRSSKSTFSLRCIKSSQNALIPS